MTTRILALLALVAVFSTGAHAQLAPKRLFVKAVDRTGAPVAGLTAADFFVAEGKSERKIVRLAPASQPLRIVLLVDDSKSMASALPDIRKGLLGFFDTIPAPHEIALVTMGNAPAVRKEPTASREVLKGLAQKMSTNGSLVLLSAVFDTYGRFLGKLEDRWPTLVLVTSDSDDASRGVTEEQFTKVAHDMQATETVVHAVVLLSSRGKSSGASADNARALAKATGGSYESASASSALPDKLAAVAGTILAKHQLTSAQYILDYESDGKSPDLPKVASTREGVNLMLSQQGRIR